MTRSFDHVVIGGGVMGASILFQLAKRGGGSALLLEQSTLGFGSTGRSSGVIRMHYSTEVHTRLSWESLNHLAKLVRTRRRGRCRVDAYRLHDLLR